MLIPDEAEKSRLNKAELDAQYYPSSGPSSSGPSSSVGVPAFPQANLDQPPSYEASNANSNTRIDRAFAPVSAANRDGSNTYARPQNSTGPPVPQKDGTTPASFLRPAPANIDRTPFTPMYLTAKKKSLSSGFPICPPPVHGAQSHIHPFSTRDITQEDWNTFLNDLNMSTQLKPKEKNFSRNIPLIGIIPFISPMVDVVASQVYLSQKDKSVAMLVDRWNHHFFAARSLEIVFLKGAQRLSGAPGAPVPQLHSVLGSTPVPSPIPSPSPSPRPGQTSRFPSGPGHRSAPSDSLQIPGSHPSGFDSKRSRSGSMSSSSSESSTESSLTDDDISHGKSPQAYPAHVGPSEGEAGPSTIHRTGSHDVMDRSRRREMRRARKSARRERRARRREVRRERRDQRRLQRDVRRPTKEELSGIHDNLYRLVVIPL